MNISLIVACMDREENLIQSIESWLSVKQIKEFIIIDYSSKKPIKENPYFEKLPSNVKIFRVENEKYFNLAKAYNLATDLAENKILLKIDGDYKNINSSWLSSIVLNNYHELDNYFIRGSWTFSNSLSGFLLINKKDFLGYREDLIGWGYEEIDLYYRIKTYKIDIREIIWFDIKNNIEHIEHEESLRVVNYLEKDKEKTEFINRNICQTMCLDKIKKQDYTIKDNTVEYKEKKKIDKIYCINLDKRKDRWDDYKDNINIERFSAIDSSSYNLELQKKHKFSLDPIGLSAKLYFKSSPGAVGAFLSHYYIWERIVKENIQHALIIEDDVDNYSLNSYLENNPVLLEEYDFINLSKRIRYKNNRFIFDGLEAYILSYVGALKLHTMAQNTYFLSNFKTIEIESIERLISRNFIKNEYKIENKHRTIVAAADKFVSYCCDENCILKLKYLIYPYFELNEVTSQNSDINISTPIWEKSEEEVLKMYEEIL
jgi:hypothetical protein